MRGDVVRGAVIVFVAAAALVAGWLIGRESGETIVVREYVARPAPPALRGETAALRDARRRERAAVAPPDGPIRPADADPSSGAPNPKMRLVVRDRDGVPIDGAGVQACGTLGIEAILSSRGAPEPKRGSTGRDGAVLLDLDPEQGAASGSIHLVVSHHGHVPAEVSVPRAAALDTGVDVVLDRNIEVRGRCVDERGAALPGVLVRAPRDAGDVTTEADGSFSIDGLPETATYVRVYRSIIATTARSSPGWPTAARISLRASAR